MRKIILSVFILSFVILSCENSSTKNGKEERVIGNSEIKKPVEEKPYQISTADEKLANVFKKLDGTWKGNYVTIKDIDPILRTSIDLENLVLEYVTKPGLTLINNLEGEHVLSSKSPYLQEFSFYDFYPKEKKTRVSTGANKVENGKIYRVIKNEKETITLNGTIKNDSTLTWSFQQDVPQRIEFYQETISDKFIEVIGYSYDELDRLDLGPRKWYYGKFVRE